MDITNRKLADPSLQCCMLHSAEECEKERLEEEKNQQLSHSQHTGGFDMSRWTGPLPDSSGYKRWSETSGYLVLLLSLVMMAAA